MSKGSKAIAIGALVVLSISLLSTVSGSASQLYGQGFMIRAVDTDDPSIERIVGDVDSSSALPPGSSHEDTSAILATYSCGPMSLVITQDMIDLANSNMDLYYSGKESEMIAHPDGWYFMSYTLGGMSNRTYWGERTKYDQLQTVEFKKSFYTSIGHFDSEESVPVARYYNWELSENDCSIGDRRGDPTPGKRAGYIKKDSSIHETRYDFRDGKVVLVSVSEENGIFLKEVVNGSNGYEKVPGENSLLGVYFYTEFYFDNQDDLSAAIGLNDANRIVVTDSYREFRVFTDNEAAPYRRMIYRLYNDGSKVIEFPQRYNVYDQRVSLTHNVPMSVKVDKNGLYTEVVRQAGPNTTAADRNTGSRTNAQMVANYNKYAPMAWDGTLPEVNIDEMTTPSFRVTAP